MANTGVLVCPVCYSAQVRVMTAMTERLGARTFYVDSFTEAGVAWVVKRFRSGGSARFTCNCPNYTHVGQVLGVPCKHVRLIKLLIRAAHGVTRIRYGVEILFRLDEGFRQRVRG